MSSPPRLIIALDFKEVTAARALVDQLNPALCRLKIGNILFTRYGPALIQEWQARGFSIFLDLKFHDIPETVVGACRAAAELGVWMVNMHVSSGPAACRAAVETMAAYPPAKRPLLIGVTILTSLQEQDLQEVGITQPVPDLVLQLATLANNVGFDGVVCSPQEISLLRTKLNKNFLLVTPGIRWEESVNTDDQKRIATPAAAIAAGADYLVIGRPITQAKNPLTVLQLIYDSIS